MLAEPMPTRDVRNGFLLYEATEGGAPAFSTRLVSQETSLATVAREALRIMHLAVGDGPLPDSPSGLADQAGGACVAACYRCLMSYYNQPDHEGLDRRDEDARAMLLRLARARTAPRENRPSTAPGPAVGKKIRVRAGGAPRHCGGGFPRQTRSPSRRGGRSVRCVWRRHYVAAVIDEADRPALEPMEDLGFEIVRFEDPAGWGAAFARLASALGDAS